MLFFPQKVGYSKVKKISDQDDDDQQNWPYSLDLIAWLKW